MLNSRKITTKLPLNIVSEHEHFFLKFRNQTITTLKVKKLKNVFVNQQGLVLKNALLVKGCAFNLFGNSDNTFYFSFWRKTLEQYLVCKFGSSLKSIKLNDDRRYLLIHSAWFNYSFWINSYLLRLITVLKTEDITNLYLLYPEEWDSIPYVKDSLDYFKIPIQRIPKDNHVFVRNLFMPETRMWTNSFDSFTIRYVYDWFSFLKDSKKPFRRVYLTRQKRNVRCVENEEELINLLSKFDFEVKSFEELSFIDQVQLMMQTEHFISIHGAGFSNVLFMQPRTSVMELINMEYANLEYTFPFWKLAESLGLHYYYQFGHIQNIHVSQLIDNHYDSNKEYLVNQNIKIDLDLFEFNLKQMLVNSQNS